MKLEAMEKEKVLKAKEAKQQQTLLKRQFDESQADAEKIKEAT